LLLLCRIRRVHLETGMISTFAGVGTPGFSGDGGPAVLAELNNPSDLAFDASGNLLVADSLSHAIRRINTSGTIDTFVGIAGKYGDTDHLPAKAARLWSPMGIALDQFGNLFISDSYNNRIRRVDAQTGMIDTIAGTKSGGFGGDDGVATEALMSNPQGIVVDPVDGSVLFSDYNNHRVRKLSCSTAAWDS
jgi:DNA-binding beta-propeller fold protein YncE